MPSLIQITSSGATNTLPTDGFGLIDSLQDFGIGGGFEVLTRGNVATFAFPPPNYKQLVSSASHSSCHGCFRHQ